MGYHRLLTHRGYRTPKWVEYVLTVCGTLALEGGPIFFVAIHRMHHQNTDKEGDPHSPQDGGLWSHVGWILTGQSIHNDSAILLPYVPDLRKDKFHVWISRWHWIPMTILGGLLLFLGGMVLPSLGHLLSHCTKSALDLACQLGDPYVGFAEIFDWRHLPK